MKKTAVIIICISLVTAMLTGCSKDEFMQIVRFTDNMNSVMEPEERISLSSYLLQNSTYYLPIDENGESVILALEEGDSGYIEKIRITAAKTDEQGNACPFTEERKNLFISAVNRAIRAYAYYSEEETENIIKDMRLDSLSTYKSEGELTLEKGNYYFVYYSTDIASMFMIFNVHLHPVEKTQKPESKPFFGNTTNIRTETVPLR